MKIISKLCIAGKTLLTVDGDVSARDFSEVLIDGKKYPFEIAYDMKNTIGINVDHVDGNDVMFL